jgi:regulator of replication initiation timing
VTASTKKGSHTLCAENKHLKIENEQLLVERDNIGKTITKVTAQVDSAEKAVEELSRQFRERGSLDQWKNLRKKKKG